jgi:hypothetical protein
VSERRENLLFETIRALKEYGKTPEDIEFFQAVGGALELKTCDWAGFVAYAETHFASYYPGHGSQEVPAALVIVGSNWWLERSEYDGAEWWSFKQKPEPHRKVRKVRT